MKGAILVFAGLIAGSASPRAAAEGMDDKLDPKIPKADPKKYGPVRDSKDWPTRTWSSARTASRSPPRPSPRAKS